MVAPRLPPALVLAIALLLLVQRIRGASVHSPDPRSDEDLYRRYAEGDERAFRVLLDRHSGEVLGYLARFFGDREMATDLTQDVFLKVIAAADDFRGDSSFRTFLFRIAHNHCVNHIVRRRPTASLQELELDPEDGARPVEARLTDAQQSARLHDAVRRLPLIQRQVVMLALEDLDYAEIAAVLGITETNVGVRLNRARASLRKMMGEGQ